MGKILFAIIVKYVESHPDQIAELVHEGVAAAIKSIKDHNAKA